MRLTENKVVKSLMVVFLGLGFLPGVGFAGAKNSADESPVFNCLDFSQKIQDCEPYLCEITLAAVPMVTQIQGRKNGRCVVATTVGILKKSSAKNTSGRTVRIPVTTICEYDQEGISHLGMRFDAMKNGRYNFSSKDTQVGEHNCRTATEGQIFNTPKDSKKADTFKSARNKPKVMLSASTPL